jgi:hypothetical protein
MSDRIDELVAILTARICLSPDCSGDVSCEDCQGIAQEAIAELASIARKAEQLQEQRDIARAAIVAAQGYINDVLGCPSPDFIATVVSRAREAADKEATDD